MNLRIKPGSPLTPRTDSRGLEQVLYKEKDAAAMSTLTLFVILYLIVSIGIGLYAARMVHGSKDYVVAGRSLPLYIVTATVFATWFGSETVLGISSTFLDEGLGGIVSDPFGASMCLILVGIYRRKYGRTVEVMISVAICISYLGWVSAQIAALGLVFNVLSDGGISREFGMIIGISVVMIYTIFGGMWSVALTDFIQMIVICIGMVIVCIMISGMVEGGTGAVIAHAVEAQKFEFWPPLELTAILAFVAAFLTMALGSIPQQDVFQRVMSAKNAATARNGAILGGSLYLLFAFIPIFIAYAATLIDPSLIERHMTPDGDTQMILPEFILSHMPMLAQILFFGALLSAIMSTASGTLLAPSALLAENILKPMLAKMDDQHFLVMLRLTVLAFGGIVTLYAYASHAQGLTIFEMVENAYMVTLCGAFVPLAFGVYWKRANVAGGTLSILMGVGTWIMLEAWAFNIPEDAGDLIVPPQLAGLCMAIVGMLIGGYFGRTDHRHEGPNQAHQDHPHGHRGIEQSSGPAS
jgi:solute:Na+ symporter, SSS family